ncbi:phosphate-starvation-inducible PsiE family protein [Thiomicrorhabdus sp. zzn3]|uniref:phosphate-starvation-inducible PsiE family protein n=1 Tax=Thiomicrorhabdus sp. zzn3 TaxID=3039775 RepID=UPI002436E0E7|nr:phosphate-starvation-inducible PsiE family protein [Thiomicrorhabdus sp. zzn3]MDG6778998.1 phosphate-starvation-inducible PsiE family protein [Thiomicrorhabdus sp. zzn3]
MNNQSIDELHDTPSSPPKKSVEKGLSSLIHMAEFVGLAVIALATIYAGAMEVMGMIELREVTLGDLLLLFLYLEVLAMIAIYLDSGKLPIRLPLYIAIVALARYLILDLKELNEWQMLAIGGTITLITIAILILRYGHLKFPYDSSARRRGR